MKNYLFPGSILGSASLFCLFPLITTAQILPDGTLPVNSIVTPQGNINLIEGGTRAGSNLFHSFREFSIPTSSEAFFNNPVDINNIFTRVTGSTISNIDGLIKANGTANLFFINPNGIVFGANAQLNIGGSFLASTASGIRFADGTEFNTTPNQNTSLLTINVPIGLQYGANPGSITVQGQGLPLPTPVKGETIAQQAAREIQLQQQWLNSPIGLGVQPGRTLALVGGNVALEGGILKAPSGRIELGGVADAGLVSLNSTEQGWALGYANIPTFGNIQLSQLATVIASGEGGGDIQIQGRQVALTGESRIFADTLGDRNGGTVSVQAGQLNLSEGSGITTDTLSQGKGGNLLINASEVVELIGVSPNNSSSRLQTITVSNGDAGDLTLTTGRLIVRDGARITTSTYANGAAGNLLINSTDSVEIVGTRPDGFPTPISSAIEGGENPNRSGGNLTIETGTLSIRDGARLSTETFAPGNAGNIQIRARDLVEIKGQGAITPESLNEGFNSTLSSSVLGGVGNGGNIAIETERLNLQDGGAVLASVSVSDKGNGGNIEIQATERVDVVGTTKNGLGSRLETSLSSNSAGKAGNISINTSVLSIRSGAQISTTTYGQGDAGNIQIRATDLVEVNGQGAATPKSPNGGLNSLLSSSVLGGVGNGGNIEIETGRLSVQDGGTVLANVDLSGQGGRGNGGNIEVQAAERVDVAGTTKSGLGSRLETSLSSDSTGKAGNISINTRILSIRNGGDISTTTSGKGDAGNLHIQAKDLVEVEGEGVDVTLEPEFGFGENVKLGGNHSSLRTDVTSSGIGNGGNLTIETGTLSIRDGGQVSAGLSGLGKGGDIEVRASEKVEIVGASRPRIFFGETIRVSSTLSTDVGAKDIGQDETINQGGNININTPILSLFDGGRVSSGLFGKGNAGSIQIEADNRVEIAGAASDGNNSSILTSVLGNGEGKGGNIDIDTQVLNIRDSGLVSAATAGMGDAGNIQIKAKDTVEAIGISDGSTTGVTTMVLTAAKGEGGSITIETGRLRLQEGYISADTAGDGNAGSIWLKASDAMELSSNSTISATTISDTGRGGRITIETGRLEQTGGSDIAAVTSSLQPGGTITVRAKESVALGNGSSLSVFTNKKGDAGSVTVIAPTVDITGNLTNEDGELVSRMSAFSIGQGAAGSVSVETGRLRVRDGGIISVSSTKSGNAGNLNIIADFVELSNEGSLGARTAAGNQGNINIDSQSLILRRGSQINTNATDTATGGNININTNTLAALENSDISANSLNAQGGTVTINAQAIFGAQVRTRDELIRLLEPNDSALLDPSDLPSSDITATGKDASLSGTVAVNTPDINPGAGLVELSENLGDATGLVTSSCRARGSEQSRFTVTGRGGLPPNPYETIGDEATWMDLRSIAISQSTQPNRSSSSSLPTSPRTQHTPEIIEAQGWTVNEKGQITLVAKALRVTAFATGLRTNRC